MVRAGETINDVLTGVYRLDKRRHIVQFYEDENYLYEVVSHFILQGIYNQEGVLIIATRPHVEGIEAHIRAQGFDFQTVLDLGQLFILDVSQALLKTLVNGLPSPERFVEVVGELIQSIRKVYPRVRIYGEMVDFLCARGNSECAIQIERFWNEVIADRSLTLLCAYSLCNFKDQFQSKVFEEICLAHTRVIPSEKFIQSETMESEGRKVAVLQQKAIALETAMDQEKERLKLILQEKEARAEAERANRAKDEFLAIVSHELRTPLQPIFSWVHLIKMGKLDHSQIDRGLKIIERSARAQAQIINDLLDISGATSGKLMIERRRMDLASIVGAAVEDITSDGLMAEVGIRIRKNETAIVQGDPARLQQVMWNLLSNAIKFTPPGGHVDVTLERLGNEAKIVVRDTGKGISPAFLPHIFDRFRQEDSSRSRPKGGLGLGLAIVHSLIHLHGGSIRAESEGEGKGTTFTLLLPIAKEGVDSRGLSRVKGIQNHLDLDLAGLRILLVDDEADTRDAVAESLRSYGGQVQTADSASDGLSAVIQSLPDLLLCDLGMPGEDGYSFIAKIRSSEFPEVRNIPAIALTAFVGEVESKRVLKAGFQAHISKPVDVAALIRVICKIRNDSRNFSTALVSL